MFWTIIIAGLIAITALGVNQLPKTFTKSDDLISPVPIVTASPAPISFLPTPTASPSATPTPTLIPRRPTSKPTPTKTPELSPTPTDSPDVYGLTEKFAAEYGIDANSLRHIAQCESGFNPNSEHLVYGGLFQFSGAAWKTYRTQMNQNPDPALRFNAAEAIRTAAYIISINHQSIWPNCLP